MAVNQTRNAYFSEIARLMAANDDLMIVSVDLAGPPFDEIRARYPDRYIGVGIAEQNAVSVACGLAAAGAKPIVYAANPFPLLRAFDQVRNCACAMRLPVTLVGLGTGFSVAECGTTHLTVEDISLASSCAGLDVVGISDTEMATFFAKKTATCDKPTYLRFGKWAGDPLGVFGEREYAAGYRQIRPGKEAAIVSIGCTVKLLSETDLPTGVALYDWFRLSDPRGIAEELKGFDRILTVEEHQKRGGIGTLLLEAFNDLGITKTVKRIGIDLPDGYPGEYGTREYWLERFGVTRDHILELLGENKTE